MSLAKDIRDLRAEMQLLRTAVDTAAQTIIKELQATRATVAAGAKEEIAAVESLAETLDKGLKDIKRGVDGARAALANRAKL